MKKTMFEEEKKSFDNKHKPDLTPVFMSPLLYNDLLDEIEANIDDDVTHLCGNDGLGFLFAGPIANRLKLPLITTRKNRDTPLTSIHKKFVHSYTGECDVQIRNESIPYKKNVVIIEDMIATGANIVAVRDLLEEEGAHVSKVIVPFGYAEFGYEDKLGHTPLHVIKRYETA